MVYFDDMLKQNLGRLFPLRLAPIDLYFQLMDRPSYPMTFVSHLYLTGQLDRDAFQAALEDAIRVHPLLATLIGKARKNETCWLENPNNEPHVEWLAENEPFVFNQGEAFDLTKEPGLRLWVRQGRDQCEIAGEFHHACTDGTGAHRFWGSLLSGYGIRHRYIGRTTDLGDLRSTTSENPPPQIGPRLQPREFPQFGSACPRLLVVELQQKSHTPGAFRSNSRRRRIK